MHGHKYDYSNVIYNGASNHVNIICPKHGIFSQIASSHLSGRGCSKCVGGVSKTFVEFINDAKLIHGNKYDYSLVKYFNSYTNVDIICPKHGIFKQKPTKHLCGQGCFVCNESKGEKEIAKYLRRNSILFEREKRFNMCKNVKKLAFDFYLPNNNVLIEFDGRQHYELVNFSGSHHTSLSEFNRIKENDNIKNNFAKLYNFDLLRIKFNKINEIDKILDSYEPISRR